MVDKPAKTAGGCIVYSANSVPGFGDDVVNYPMPATPAISRGSTGPLLTSSYLIYWPPKTVRLSVVIAVIDEIFY